MTKVSSSNSPESLAIQQYQNKDSATGTQKALAGAAQDAVGSTTRVNQAYRDLQSSIKSGSAPVNTSGLTHELVGLHDNEKKFWQAKVNEDQSWVDAGGGQQAQDALKSDMGALKNFDNNDYVQDIEIQQKDGTTKSTNSINEATVLSTVENN